MKRRQFLQTTTAITGALLAGNASVLDPGKMQPALAHGLHSLRLTPFVDPLPIPNVLKPIGQIGGHPFYQLTMSQFRQKLHKQLPPTTVWGFNGTYPGPTIIAQVNQPIVVKYLNNLPDKHLFAIDPTIMPPHLPAVRTTTHLHGGHVPPQSNGNPLDWFTPGHSKTVTYPNLQPATTLWYHDHALGITRLNVYAGLAGFYLLTDPNNAQLNLPKAPFEIGLAIQDRSFTQNGQLFYPSHGVTPVHPVWVPEFFGDTALVNGKAMPFLNVEPRKYRFRILNGCNARFLRLSLDSAQPFIQIGAEEGFLPKPVRLMEILVAPAERADVILDFKGMEGQIITMTNNAPAPFPGGGAVELPLIMQFKVSLPLSSKDTSSIPSSLPVPPIPPESSAVRTRNITLDEILNAQGVSLGLLLNNTHFNAPVTEKPKLNTTEIWRFINLTGDAHPMHLHDVMFHILDRQPFDVQQYIATRQLVFTGPPILPDPNEAGFKDTVKVYPGQIARLITRFTDFTGRYVYHCHILEHEDNDMMRPFEVVP
ncbi:MAG TPA: multicopper oxidase [Ktedonosporobacter sp.]|nr:multicopper oxidase [Ktedonosporobacter sp.]